MAKNNKVIRLGIGIHGYDFDVYFVDGDDERMKDLDGRCYCNEFAILIRKDLDKRIIYNVLKHEIAHAILTIQGRYSHDNFTQDDLCEFISWQGDYICNKAKEVMACLEED